jgi:hypothetical protein
LAAGVAGRSLGSLLRVSAGLGRYGLGHGSGLEGVMRQCVSVHLSAFSSSRVLVSCSEIASFKRLVLDAKDDRS